MRDEEVEAKEEEKQNTKLPSPTTGSSGEDDDRKVGKRKKGKKLYVENDFKFAQPLLKKHLVHLYSDQESGLPSTTN